MLERVTFFTEFIRNYKTTGSVMPSGRALGGALCRHVGRGSGPQKILEAGPGTGAVTGCIIERMRREDELWMVELNPAFAAYLRGAFKEQPHFRDASNRCHLIEGSILGLDPASEGQFDLVISCLPFNNFPAEAVRDILRSYAGLLKPGGMLSFFQYILVRPAKQLVSAQSERTRLKGVGEAIDAVLGERELAREWIWPNVPPAWVHHVRY